MCVLKTREGQEQVYSFCSTVLGFGFFFQNVSIFEEIEVSVKVELSSIVLESVM